MATTRILTLNAVSSNVQQTMHSASGKDRLLQIQTRKGNVNTAVNTDSTMSSSAQVNSKKRCRVAIIGAGASGITTAKCLRDDRHEPTVFESTNQIGGVWVFRKTSGGTFQSLHLQNSKYLATFSDYPMADNVSDFPHHTEVLKYLNDYVDRFKLRDCIKLNTKVEKVTRKNDCWEVTIRSKHGEATYVFDAIAICSGVYHEARWPNFPGEEKFEGKILHAKDYKEPSFFAEKNVVVVGNGASGVDIAVSASFIAKKVVWSFRRNAWLLPRFVSGCPIDCSINRIYKFLPSGLRSLIFKLKLSQVVSDHRRCNLYPSFGPFNSIPNVNEYILNRIRIGAIQPKPSITGFEERRIFFKDGTSMDADIVVYATGYELTFPFFDSSINLHKEGVDLYKHVFHPDFPNCAFIGMLRVVGALFPCAEIQARWFSKVLSNEVSLPEQEQMRAEIKKSRVKQEKNWTSGSYRSFQVSQIEYIDEIAAQIKARPKIWRHWKIAWPLLAGPIVPAQYRLDGPNRWECAEDWIRKVPQIIRQ